MRKKIVAGNWKMNKTFDEGIELIKEINKNLKTMGSSKVETIIAPPFIYLYEANKESDSRFVAIGAQNCASEPKGAYTGEISAAMINSTGCKYVILGHSERRTYYGETSDILVKKIKQALENRLEIIFCIGESLEERTAGKHFKVIEEQISRALFQLNPEEFTHIVLAYEPVWAIGTGTTATSAQAQEMHAFIRSLIAGKYGKTQADSVSILYGGSCNPKNADELFQNPDVDGGLIGGAALKAEDFLAIVKARNMY